MEFQGARESRKCYGWVVLCMRTRMRIRKEILLADDYSVTILFYNNNRYSFRFRLLVVVE